MSTKSKNVPLSDTAIEKLASSTLTPEDAEVLGITSISPTEAHRICPAAAGVWRELEALRLPYFGVDGTPMCDNPTWSECPPYHRLRRLGQAIIGGWAVQLGEKQRVEAEKECPRYLQPPGTMPCAYFPRLKTDWRSIAQDTAIPLIVTEGELKASAACKAGFPTLGLGGVTAWRAAKKGSMWVPSLDQIVWVRRKVYIAFDSDALGNKNIVREIQLLSNEFVKRGAFPHLLTIPSIAGLEKAGLDDFLFHHGAAGPDRLKELVERAQTIGLAAPLFNLSNRYAYVRNMGIVVDLWTMTKYTTAAFKELEAARIWQDNQLQKNGTLRMVEVSAGAAWLKWPLRPDVQRITYAPGQEQITADNELNSWRGWGCDPKKGDPGPFLELIDFLCSASEPWVKEWLLRWLAYPLQHPGVKMFVAVLIHGVTQGTGKTLLGFIMSMIYGEKNYSLISHEDLKSSFNPWQAGKQFIQGDDVAGVDRRQDADMLKKMITQDRVTVNEKYVPSYSVPDTMNYYFTSNHPNAAFLGDHDRRYLVIETPHFTLSAAFYQRCVKWLKEENGASIIFDYLLNLDLGDFNPHARAPRTLAKDRMIEHSQSDVGAWCRGLLEAPGDVLSAVGEVSKDCDLWTSSQLLSLYDPSQRGKVTAGGIGRELSAAGACQVLGGRPIEAKGFKRDRYWAIRKRESWSKVKSQTEVIAHLKVHTETKRSKY